MYSKHVTLLTFSLISLLLTASYLSKARYSLFMLKVPLNPNQSINLVVQYILVHAAVVCWSRGWSIVAENVCLCEIK